MDRFDDIWKNRFNDGKVAVDEWNSPDDDFVWDGIAAGIAPKKERRRLLWVWWSVGILLFALVLLTGFFLQRNTMNSSTDRDDTTELSLIDQFENTATEIASSSPKLEAEEPNEIEIRNKKSTAKLTKEQVKSLTSLKPVKVKTTIETASEEPNLSLSSESEGTFIPVITTEKKPVESVLLEKNPMQEKEALTTSSKDWLKQKSNNFILPSLNLAILKYEKKLPIELKELSALEDLTTAQSVSKFSIALNTGLVYWKHRISNQYTSDLSAFDFNYTDDFGWQTNLNMRYQVNQFLGLFAGLQYEQVKSSSGHNSSLTYDLNAEQNESNTYTQSLATPYGLSEATFQLNRKQAIGSNNVDLLVDFKSNHLIQNWSVPIGVELSPLPKNNKWKAVAAVGFGFNYLSGISNSINDIDSNHDAIAYETNGNASFAKPDIKKWHFDLRLGLGLNYEILPSLQIGLDYDWTRGINPIFELDNYDTKIDRHHLSLSIVKMLGSIR